MLIAKQVSIFVTKSVSEFGQIMLAQLNHVILINTLVSRFAFCIGITIKMPATSMMSIKIVFAQYQTILLW